MGKVVKPKQGAERPRVNGVRCVSDLVGQVGGAAFRRFGFVQHSIVTRWDEIVGERYAAVSSPESIRFPQGQRTSGTLTLTVEGAHAVMMQHVVPTIIDRVNRFFGYAAIARVSIRQGRAVAAPKRPAPAPVPAPMSEELGASLRGIADPELRTVLESLAQGLANKDDKVVVTAIPVIGRIGDKRR